MSTYGSLPEGWNEVELMSVSSLITDGAHSSPKPQTQGRFMCSVKDMTYNKFDFSNVKLISEEDYQFLVKQGCAPQKGDLLISKDGANCLDLLFLYDQEAEIVLLSSIAIVRLKDTVYKEYVRYFLLSPDCQFIMRNNYVSGSAIPRVVLKDFKKVPVVLPPLPEQKAIASVLSSVDDKIDLLHRQNKTLEAMAETLFRQWFIEEAKEDWEGFSVSDIAIHVKDNVNPSKDPLKTFYHFSLPAFDSGQKPTIEVGSDILSNKYRVAENSILISKLNPRVPRVWFLTNAEENYVCSTEFQNLKPKVAPHLMFLYSLFSSRNVIDELTMSASGTSGSHQRVKPEDMLNVTFRTPSLDYLEEYSLLITPSMEKVSFNKKQIQTLENLRDTLLPKLMSGEVRVQYQTEEVA